MFLLPVLLLLVSFSVFQVSADCPPGTTEGPHGGRCFKLYNDMPAIFGNAAAQCRADGGKYATLASVWSAFENKILANLAGDAMDNVWIGGFHNGSSWWRWTDGSVWSYTNWAKGYPQNPKPACISVDPTTGLWYDGDCNDWKSYVCQFCATGVALC